MVGFCPSVKSVPLQTLVPAQVVHEVKMETVEVRWMTLYSKALLPFFCFTVMNEVKQSKCLYVLYNPSLPAHKILGCCF